MSENQKDVHGSFVGHLTELRARIIKSFIFLIVIFVICYIFSEHIYRFLVQPYSDAVFDNNLDRRLIFTALHEAFLYDPGKRGAADVSFVAPYISGLDGLGSMGSGAHTPQETVNLKTFEQITQRTALLIYRLTRMNP